MNFDPNKLFYEMAEIYSKNKTDKNRIIICNEGSSRCFSPNTKVFTNKGYKHISAIKAGDKVLTFNEEKKTKEFKIVKENLRFKNSKKTIKVTLKHGKTFVATEDHKFYYKGSWVSLKHILSLLDGKKRNMENNTKF